jgi:hypothetical protein
MICCDFCDRDKVLRCLRISIAKRRRKHSYQDLPNFEVKDILDVGLNPRTNIDGSLMRDQSGQICIDVEFKRRIDGCTIFALPIQNFSKKQCKTLIKWIETKKRRNKK